MLEHSQSFLYLTSRKKRNSNGWVTCSLRELLSREFTKMVSVSKGQWPRAFLDQDFQNLLAEQCLLGAVWALFHLPLSQPHCGHLFPRLSGLTVARKTQGLK